MTYNLCMLLFFFLLNALNEWSNILYLNCLEWFWLNVPLKALWLNVWKALIEWFNLMFCWIFVGRVLYIYIYIYIYVMFVSEFLRTTYLYWINCFVLIKKKTPKLCRDLMSKWRTLTITIIILIDDTTYIYIYICIFTTLRTDRYLPNWL
jgi:hypothetical protein